MDTVVAEVVTVRGQVLSIEDLLARQVDKYVATEATRSFRKSLTTRREGSLE